MEENKTMELVPAEEAPEETTPETTERTGLSTGESFALGTFAGLLLMAAGHKAKKMYDNHKAKKAAKKAQAEAAEAAPAETVDPDSDET